MTYNGTVAIAGFYENECLDDTRDPGDGTCKGPAEYTGTADGTGTAYLWVPNGQESAGPLSLTFEVCSVSPK